MDVRALSIAIFQRQREACVVRLTKLFVASRVHARPFAAQPTMRSIYFFMFLKIERIVLSLLVWRNVLPWDKILVGKVL